MKRITLLLVLCVCSTIVFSQTKNGTVFSEHQTITKTRNMWDAFKNGDADTFISYFADSVYQFMNGNMSHIPKEEFKGNVDFWKNAYENLEIADDKPAFPDAIEYKEGGTWVQDWLRWTGTHKESGINIDIHFHNLYSFNDEGLINSIHFYFDDTVFDEIDNSATTRENGQVYINHPYIVKVRKLVNAYCNEDIDAMMEFYDEKAQFSNSAMKWGETESLENIKAELENRFAVTDNIKMKQVGYPDCIHYDKGDMWVVYSWWIHSGLNTETHVKYEFPIMVSFNFNKDGKIVSQQDYYSTNHF